MSFVSRILLAFCLGWMTVLSANGQLALSTTSLNFPVTYETAPDSLPITIRNTSLRQITVTGFRFYTTYGAPAFSVRYNWFGIPAGDSVTVYVLFSPRHNIFHNSEMVILNDGLRGYPSVDLRGQGRYSNTYYANTENLEEQLLKDTLKSIVTANYLSLGYAVGRDSMFMIYDNKFVNGQGASQNTIECIYTGREAVGYIDRTDCQNNYSFNTEHTFPQGFFGSMEPMKSDLMHLFPTDNLANNQRGDNPFGIVTNPTWTSGGSKATGTLFEPRDSHKGKVSRALLYFVIRWQDYTNFVNPQEGLLRNWHQTFLPDAVERKRNDDIFRIQGNRNPFIDYPQFTERITSVCNNSIPAPNTSVDITQDTINYGTVQPFVNTVFTFSIVNRGNTNLAISNIQLSNTAVFSFISGGNDTVIGPGDALQMRLNCFTATTDSVRAFLYFNMNMSGSVTARIPILVNDLIFTSISEIEKQRLFIYPNPSADRLFVCSGSNGVLNYILTDAGGRNVLEGSSHGSKFEINVNGLSSGMYFLKVVSDTSVWTERILVR